MRRKYSPAPWYSGTTSYMFILRIHVCMYTISFIGSAVVSIQRRRRLTMHRGLHLLTSNPNIIPLFEIIWHRHALFKVLTFYFHLDKSTSKVAYSVEVCSVTGFIIWYSPIWRIHYAYATVPITIFVFTIIAFGNFHICHWKTCNTPYAIIVSMTWVPYSHRQRHIRNLWFNQWHVGNYSSM
jgi:hypothetical protein